MNTSDTLLVGWDAGQKEGDIPVLIVGRRAWGQKEVVVVNQFQGQEAEELYSRLLKKEGQS